jgi:hypothetical protein
MDRELVEAAQKRDREAYADLIRVRGDRLYALAQRREPRCHRTVTGSVQKGTRCAI